MTIPYRSSATLPSPVVVTAPSGAARPRLTFLGTGYLGATYAICFAELGYDVLGFDVDEAKIAKLSAGEVPFHEAGLEELLRHNLAAGAAAAVVGRRRGAPGAPGVSPVQPIN